MVNKTLDIYLKIITQRGNWFNKTKETSKSTPTHSTVQVKTKCHLSQKLYIDIEQYFLMYPLAIKNIPKINKEFLTDWSNLYDMWSQQSTYACQSTLQASPLNCCTFLSPPLPPLQIKNYHDLHVSARMHPKNSLKFCLVIQKCWQAVHLCNFFFCGFYNQFQQRQRSGRNKICRKLLSSFQEANKGL